MIAWVDAETGDVRVGPDKVRSQPGQTWCWFEVIEDFDWSTAVVGTDERHDYGEVRARAFGRIAGVAHCVAFTRRGQNLRIISLRRMHDKEIRRYGI